MKFSIGMMFVVAAMVTTPNVLAGKAQNKAAADVAAGQDVQTPDEAVRALYSPYLPGGDERMSAFDNESERAKRMSADLVRQLSAYFKKQEKADEPGGLDFDPIVNGQDYKIERLLIKTENVAGGKSANIVAEFQNTGEPVRLRFKMVFEGGAWRVDNIASLRDPIWDLRNVLNEN